MDQGNHTSPPRQQLQLNELGKVIRYDGRSDKRGVVTSASFVKMPYLAMQGTTASRTSGSSAATDPRSLLQVLYHYEPDDDLNFMANHEATRLISDGSGQITVPEIWCLMVGQNVMITLSQSALKDMIGENVKIDDTILSTTRGLRSVQLRCGNEVVKRREVRRDCTFAELYQIAAHAVDDEQGTRKEAGKLSIEDADGMQLTTERWNELSFAFRSARYRERPWNCTASAPSGM
ncbi:hypothetical protein F5Y15DRAFT_221246 [Xylariaceae sp. FL0016]|nr:hypothetical protein F5Y15DRAFT_221246 [Xylariaceae sp. FL0016]